MANDREFIRVMAQIDQLQSTLREGLEKMDPDDLIELFNQCMSGQLGDLDEKVSLFVGCLAAVAIIQLRSPTDL